jgi:acyl dehydratase
MSVCAIMSAQVGAKFAGPVRRLTLERVLAFSGGPFAQVQWPDRNLHTDEGKAREAGLPGIIVSGTQFEGHLVDLLVNLFGEAWFTAGTIEIRIPQSLMLGETVQPKATLREVREADGERTFVLDVRCDNPRGEPVMIGTASCRLRAV